MAHLTNKEHREDERKERMALYDTRMNRYGHYSEAKSNALSKLIKGGASPKEAFAKLDITPPNEVRWPNEHKKLTESPKKLTRNDPEYMKVYMRNHRHPTPQ